MNIRTSVCVSVSSVLVVVVVCLVLFSLLRLVVFTGRRWCSTISLLRQRSMAPVRPVMFPECVPLVLSNGDGASVRKASDLSTHIGKRGTTSRTGNLLTPASD